MNINVIPNTSPIDATVLNPVAKSFASSGGSGGGGVTNIYPALVNAVGASETVVEVVAPGAESVGAEATPVFVGGKKTLLMASGSATGTFKIRLYVDGVLVSQSGLCAAGTASWGFMLLASPVGAKPVKVVLYNAGPAAMNANPVSLSVLEML